MYEVFTNQLSIEAASMRSLCIDAPDFNLQNTIVLVNKYFRHSLTFQNQGYSYFSEKLPFIDYTRHHSSVIFEVFSKHHDIWSRVFPLHSAPVDRQW